jgi:hypothetical protein
MRKHTYGYLYAILASFLYSLVAVVAKTLVTGGTHPIQVTFYQYLFTIMIVGTWIYQEQESVPGRPKNAMCFRTSRDRRRSIHESVLLYRAEVSGRRDHIHAAVFASGVRHAVFRCNQDKNHKTVQLFFRFSCGDRRRYCSGRLFQ